MAEGTRRILPLVLSVLLLQPLLQAQSIAPVPSQLPPSGIAYDTQPLPPDPSAALELARKVNGLGSDDLKPWYLKANYQKYNAEGKSPANGTFEVYFVSMDRYRITFVSNSFSQTFYRTEKGFYQDGVATHMPRPESEIWSAFVYPILPTVQSAKVRWATGAPAAYKCLNLLNPQSFDELYCLDAQKPQIRFVRHPDSEATFNKPALFQHHFIAQSVHISDGDIPIVDLEIGQLRVLTPSDMESMVPPSSAKQLTPLEAALSGGVHSRPGEKSALQSIGVTGPKLLKGSDDDYWFSAKRAAVQGVVRAVARVGVDGKVQDVQVTRDPDVVLGQAAVECLSKWLFKPAEYEGKPVEGYVALVFSRGATRN